MNKLAVLVCFVCLVALAAATPSPEELQCLNLIKCYDTKVNNLLNEQIAVELGGQYTYLYLSHTFMRSDLYYPRAAKFFKQKADEEMQHAEKFIEYQNRRGGTFDLEAVQRRENHCNRINSLKDGFVCARHLEVHVTRALTQLLRDISNVTKHENSNGDSCEISHDNIPLLFAQPILVEFTKNGLKQTEPFNGLDCTGITSFNTVNYIELAEMITHDFLGHQVEDTKELANFENILRGFERQKLGSFLADREFDF